MARHHQITEAIGVPVFFADPRSPWQRGTNEHTNGMLRDYFPKGTDLSVHTAADLAAVQAEMNAKPRGILGWKSPTEHLATLFTSSTVLRR
jgi:IS30 family transposase